MTDLQRSSVHAQPVLSKRSDPVVISFSVKPGVHPADTRISQSNIDWFRAGAATDQHSRLVNRFTRTAKSGSPNFQLIEGVLRILDYGRLVVARVNVRLGEV